MIDDEFKPSNNYCHHHGHSVVTGLCLLTLSMEKSIYSCSGWVFGQVAEGDVYLEFLSNINKSKRKLPPAPTTTLGLPFPLLPPHLLTANREPQQRCSGRSPWVSHEKRVRVPCIASRSTYSCHSQMMKQWWFCPVGFNNFFSLHHPLSSELRKGVTAINKIKN